MLVIAKTDILQMEYKKNVSHKETAQNNENSVQGKRWHCFTSPFFQSLKTQLWTII